MPSPQEAEELAEAAANIVTEAKAVRRRCNVLIEQGARLRDRLQNLHSEEETRNDRDSRST